MEKLKDYLLNQVADKKLSADTAFEFLESIEQLNHSPKEQTEYAVIGMACRFPQASSLGDFWQNLMQGRDCVGAFPRNRSDDVKYVNQQTFNLFNGYQCRVGGYFDRIDLFDHSFFRITPAEARVMDPSQRIFLEVAVEALENAGLTETNLRGSNTGVFVGYSINEDNYIDILPKDDPNIALGNQPSVLAYRLSFLYDMQGPTMVIDTACSSSLVAVHQACQAIAMGDCDQAIVGGVNIRLFPAIREISNLGIEAFDGRCKSFDEKADGTNIGDGVAAIIIKRRDLAEKDGDYIHAIIKGSAINSDGNANGITAPNPAAQANVLLSAWKKARINPEEIAFIETHGTGTKLGDPIEILGLTHAFSEFTQKKQFCPLGAVKTNIGHLEATSGIAGLIKAILCLENRQLPRNIHFQKPNPYIDFENSPVFPASNTIDWKESPQKLIAGISSFGISGTNCHVIVEEYKRSEIASTTTNNNEQLWFLFSVNQQESLIPLLQKYLAWFKIHPSLSLRHISYTLACARNHYDYRIAFSASNLDELRQKIEWFIHHQEQAGDIEGIYHQKQSLQSAPELIRLYLQKALINWKKYFPEGYGRKIILPTYAFNHRRHWPKLEMEKTNALDERLKSVFYQLEWHPESLNFSETALSENKGKTFLVFLHSTDVHEAFADFIESQGISIIRVYPSDEFKIEGKNCYIKADSLEDYNNLIDACLASSPAFGGVVHLWDCIPLSSALETWDKVNRSQLYGAFSIFKLVNSLQEKNPQGEWKLINLTTFAQKVSKDDLSINPTRMPALGINKVVSQEMPLVQSLAIDIDLTPSAFFAIFQEIFSVKNYPQAVVGYRQNNRYLQVLSKMDIQPLPKSNFSILKNGTYLIAGGAGYLGLATARLLAEKEPVNVILTGRKSAEDLTNAQLRKIQEIQSLGSHVEYMQADVTDIESCKKLITHIESKWGMINGIFIAIKNISHKRLEVVPFEEFSSNILAKIKGVWLLDELTKHMPVDFMATFSSISSLTGGPTGADCSASNLFLDSYGDWRNEQGRTTITMNYTLIEADDGSLLSDRLSMIPPLSKEEFLGCLNLCLTKQIPFAVMADFNSRVMNVVLPFMKIKFSEEISKQFQDKNENKNVLHKEIKTDMTFEEVLSILKQIWMDVLGHDHIESSANFFEVGGESISAVKLLHLVNVQLQIKLEIADLYSYPVLENLAQFISDKVANKNDVNSLNKLLEDFQLGKIDINKTIETYEQIR